MKLQFRPLSPLANARGVTYLLAMMAVVLIGISITVAAKQWKTMIQREQEADLLARGIEADIHYPLAAHLQPACAQAGVPAGRLPEAERASSEVLSLPMFPELSSDQIERVVSSVREFCGT